MTAVTPAEAYEAFLVPAIFGPWARAVLRRRPPAAGDRVLDVACGTGIGARLAAAIVGRSGSVTALDADAAMLAVARASALPADAAAIRWHHANAVSMPFHDHAFDHVLCLEGIQFFPDRPAGLREIRRVLRPGGAFVASVWGPLEQNPAYHSIAEGLRELVSDDAARLPPFALSDADTVRDLVANAGFAAVTVSVERQDVNVPSSEALIAWVAAGGPTMRHSLARLSSERRKDFEDLVAARLAPYRTERGLVVPSTRHVVVAR